MNVALIIDHEPLMRSFKWTDGMAYGLDGEPYDPPFGIRNVFNIPKPFNGYFLAFNQGLIDIDFDVVFLAIEKGGCSVQDIRRAYPKARVFSMVKEKNPTWHMPQSRADFFNQCDACLVPYRDHVLSFVKERVNVPVHQFLYPYDGNELCKMPVPFEERTHDVIVGCNTMRGIDATLEFARKLEIRTGLKSSFTNSGNLSWKEWLLLLGNSKVCLNFDQKPEIGQLPIECACTGTLHIGGVADAAETLWPDSFGNDQEVLLSKVEWLLSNRNELIKKAGILLVDNYGYEAARKRLDEIISS